LTKIDSALPVGFSLAPIVQFLGQKAAENSLVMTSIELSPDQTDSYEQMVESAGKEVKKLAFVVHVMGSYAGIKSFLSGVESSARVFQVRSMTLEALQTPQGSAQDGGLARYQATLEIETYAY
jgi:Tfp pilus assembly protein PilO